MNEAVIFSVQAFVALFIITSPLGAVPLFITITPTDTPAQRARAARTAGITCTIALLTAALLGKALLDLFSISIPAFRIAGGAILFVMAFDMLQVRRTRLKSTEEEVAEAIDRVQIGVTPMGIPMLAGPGAITTVLALSAQVHGRPVLQAALLSVIVLTGAVGWLILALAARLRDRLSPIVLGIVTRVEGLLLATIAVQMFLDGLKGALPALASG